ncbi:phage head morphogenesis protein [Bombella apis]|uniref:phage head morphogenesis protein n=1 Tax=Bombella apis TaxID=1785988 RepID=UPI0024A9157D|nr:phage minor head protein [Bombella apis]
MSKMDSELMHAAGLPPSEAISFFRQKNLVPTERWGEVMNEAHARGFAVAGAAGQALLTDMKAAINSALTDGRTLQEFQRDFEQIAKTHKWDYNGSPGWRARIIYSTNLATAYSAGQFAQLDTDEARDIFPCWEYVHHECQHPRLDHLAWSGLVLRNDDPWWTTHYPPNGWRCHCTVRPVSRSEMKSRGLVVNKAPPLDLRPWRNPATGKTEMVPRGIDPSFAYNPGMAWKEKRLALEAAQPPLSPRSNVHLSRAAAMEQQADDIGKLLRPGALGSVNAGTLPESVKNGLGTLTDDVILSDDTLGKNRKHREITGDDYRALPEMISAPLVAKRDDDHNVLLISGRAGKLYRIVVKRTKSGKANFVQTFCRIYLKRAISQIKQGTIIAGSLDDLVNFEEK